MILPNPLTFLAAIFNTVCYWFSGYVVIVPEDVEKLRLDHCRGCKFFDWDALQCEKCGCPVEAKVMVASEKCPVGKWKQWKRIKLKVDKKRVK